MIRIGVHFESGKVQIQGVGIIPVLWDDFDDIYTALQDLTTNPIAFKSQAKL
nr:1029_t:CDS:2 [Entrophospora candida]